MKTIMRLLTTAVLLKCVLAGAVCNAAQTPDANGFLQQWLLLEPVKVSGQLSDSAVRDTVQQMSLPGKPATVPSNGDKVQIGNQKLQWHAADTSTYNINLYHFAHALGLPTSNVLFWAITVVDSPRAMTGVRLAIGSNAASMWWLNGNEVIDLYNERQTVIDDGVSKRLTLQAGRNVIRAAIINAGGATDFAARFLDENGIPVQDLIVNPGH